MSTRAPPSSSANALALDTLEALARSLETVLDTLSAAGEERDDRPRVFAHTLARWARGESKAPELDATVRALDELAPPLDEPGPQAWARVVAASVALAAWRARVAERPADVRDAVADGVARLALVLAALGEHRDAACARALGTFARHFSERTGRAPVFHAPSARLLARDV